MRFAFYGRVSTEDAQDPSLSIPRQLRHAIETAATRSARRSASTYWDIESGRKDLAERGKGSATERGSTSPRDGGLHELLASAKADEFDAVIVESIDRLSRMTADATRIERELEQRDIALFATDEPMSGNATAILTRRVKQGVAEWYVRDLIEKSRRGMEESVRQGWHTGGPAPYGYQLEPHPHPNPNKARDGEKKHRLIPDPIKAPIVQMIFEDCLHASSGSARSATSSTATSTATRHRRATRRTRTACPQTWSRSQLHSMLRNPKYTGYNVWGRHDKRPGRPFIRPREQWVWSPTPSHEAIVPPRAVRHGRRARPRNDGAPAKTRAESLPAAPGAPQGRLYPLRGRVRCGLCGRRMEGSHQKGSNWYRCHFVEQARRQRRRRRRAPARARHQRGHGPRRAARLHGRAPLRTRTSPPPTRRARPSRHPATGRNATRTRPSSRRAKSRSSSSLYRQTLRLEEHDDPEHPVVKLAKQRIEELSRQAAPRSRTRSPTSRRPSQRSPPRGDRGDAGRRPRPARGPAAAEGEELAELLDAFDVDRQLRQAGPQIGAERSR